MINLETKYLGIKLKNPLMLAASTFSLNIEDCKKAQDAGAAGIVLHSLFEEQIEQEAVALNHYLSQGEYSFPEALNYLPEPEEFYDIDGEAYLEHIRNLKKELDIPIIGSLNGYSAGGWMDYAQKIEEAGADALELNIYYIPTNPKRDAKEVEQRYIDDIRRVRRSVDIPVAIKLSPYFSAFANIAKAFEREKVDGLVLFNRFYQPDIDIETRELVPSLEFSNPYELRLPLRWIAILREELEISLAATSGIHTYKEVVKSIMSGADATMMASALYEKGLDHIAKILKELQGWMEEHEYSSIEQLKGCMSYKNVQDKEQYVRTNYMKTIQSMKL